ncbi:MAG: efflux RND transporter periplasmic adaptor subunit [Leptolyngbyaceae cyanobacterium]
MGFAEWQWQQLSRHRLLGAALLGVMLTASGCRGLPRVVAQPEPPGASQEQPPAVETLIVATGSIEAPMIYTGSTQPAEAVTLRAQTEGQITALTVDVGDAVAPGQPLAQIDANLLTVGVNQAQAELTARQSEVAQAEAAVSDAQTLVEQARLQVQQARIDADRFQQLAVAGAASDQAAEQAQLTLDIAQQALLSAQEQVVTRQQAVNAAQGRVAAQGATVDQTQERLSFATARSPLNGRVLSRLVEAGDYVQTGAVLMTLGDLATLHVELAVSELDLAQITRGQPVQVRLDAFPDEVFSGRVTRISPAADGTTRLVPVEVTFGNPAGQLGSGLLARVQFLSAGEAQVVIPESALETGPPGADPTVFVVQGAEENATVQARPVELGDRGNGQVEILAGLNPGDALVVRSDRPLEEGQSVRLSLLSEPRQ